MMLGLNTIAILFTHQRPSFHDRVHWRCQVCRCAVWREGGQRLFAELKAVAQGFMDAVSRECAKR